MIFSKRLNQIYKKLAKLNLVINKSVKNYLNNKILQFSLLILIQ